MKRIKRMWAQQTAGEYWVTAACIIAVLAYAIIRP
mgnify:CR=1 FL=1